MAVVEGAVPQRTLQNLLREGSLAEIRARLDEDRPAYATWQCDRGRNLLVYAVQRGSSPQVEENLELCRYLVETIGVDVNHRASEVAWYQSPLFYAAKTCSKEVVEYLIEREADIHHADRIRQTPLFYAAQAGNEASLHLLLACRADAAHRDFNDHSALMYAVRGAKPSHKQCALALIEAMGGDFDKRGAKDGHTPLFHVILHAGLPHMLGVLFDAKANIDAVDATGKSCIFFAASMGRNDCLRVLLERGASTDLPDGRLRQTALFWAASYSNPGGIRMLLIHDADASHRDTNGHTALFYAVRAKTNQADCVRALLEAPNCSTPQAQARDIQGRTPLFFAMTDGGTVETCNLLVDYNCDINAVDNRYQQSAMFFAAREGRVDCIETLMSRRAAVDLRDYQAQTPLFFAVNANHLEACRALIEKGRADPFALSKMRCSPKSLVLQNTVDGQPRNPELKRLFQEIAEQRAARKQKRNAGGSNAAKRRRSGGAGGSKGGSAVDGADDDCLSGTSVAGGGGGPSAAAASVMADARADLELLQEAVVEAHGSSGALINAVLSRPPGEVHKLIEEGRDPKAVLTQNGRNLLFLAALRPDKDDIAVQDMCRLLIQDHGFQPMCMDSESQTPLFLSARHDLPKTTSYLLEARVDPQHADRHKQTALFHAVMLDASACVAALAEGGADLNALNASARTPLYEAAAAGKTGIVELLLAHGASTDVDGQDKVPILSAAASPCVTQLLAAGCSADGVGGESPPLHVAAESGDVPRILALLEARASVNLSDKSGRTPLHWAVDRRQLEACRLLIDMHAADANAKDASGVSPLVRAKAMRWSAARELELLSARRVDQDRRAKEAAVVQKLRQLVHVTQHGPPEQLRDLLNETGDLLASDGSYGVLPLVHAAAARPPERGAVVEICRVLVEDAKLSPSTLDVGQKTPLFKAVASCNYDLCRYLIEKECDVNARDAEGRTALFDAGRLDLEAMRVLLEARADPEQVDSLGQTALFHAAPKDPACVALLLEARASAAVTDLSGQTPLFGAVRDGADASVRSLVKARAAVNHQDVSGKPALFFAIRETRSATAALLLDECGAWPPDAGDPPIQGDDFGNNDLFEMARDRGIEEIVSKLTEARQRRRAELAEQKAVEEAKARLAEQMFNAVMRGTAEDIARIMAQKADVAALSEDGRGVLHCAASRFDDNADSCCRALLEVHGADIAARDSRGRSALFSAVRSGLQDRVCCLLEFRCDIGMTDKAGETVLFEAARLGQPDMVSLLLSRKADACAQNALKQNAAFVATKRGLVATLRLLLDGGVPADSVDAAQRTALFGAEEPQAIRLLVSSRCDVSARDTRGRTAIFTATSPSCMQELLEARADIDAVDPKKQTALVSAVERGDIDIVRALVGSGADANIPDTNGQTALFHAIKHRVPLSLVQTLVCEGLADAGVRDENRQTPVLLAKKARPPQAGLVEFLTRLTRRPRAANGGAVAPESEPQVMRFCFMFSDPMDKTGAGHIPFGTPEYEERLHLLEKQCPWLRTDLWKTDAPLTRGVSLSASWPREQATQQVHTY